jgi:hypothetical protein
VPEVLAVLVVVVVPPEPVVLVELFAPPEPVVLVTAVVPVLPVLVVAFVAVLVAPPVPGMPDPSSMQPFAVRPATTIQRTCAVLRFVIGPPSYKQDPSGRCLVAEAVRCIHGTHRGASRANRLRGSVSS